MATATVAPRSAARALPAGAILLVGTAVVATAAFLLVHEALIDDAYITMSYARNLAFHLHWGLIADETANSATSPLNVLLLGLLTAVVRDGVVAVGVLFVGSVVLAARWLDSLATALGLARWLPVFVVGLLVTGPLMLSTIGLEPYLTAALLAGLLRYGAAARPVVFGLVAGLTVLARPDLGVVVVVVALMVPGVRHGLLRAVGAALVVLVPWYAFSWLALGSALPDTLVIKAGSATWSGFGFWNGPLLYLNAAPAAAILSFLPVVAGALVLVGLLVGRVIRPWQPWQQVAAAIGVGSAAHYVAYSLLHTAPYHWYYAPMIVGGTLCAGIAAARLTGAAALAVGAAAGVLAAGGIVCDLANGVPWQRAVIQTNWASAGQYERVAADLRTAVGPRTVESPGEIGTLAYYCDCSIVDQFSDRGRVIGAINAREQRSGTVARFLLALDYRNLDRTQQPRPVDARLVYESHQEPNGPQQWPVDRWADGSGRLVLEPGPG